MVVSPPKAHPSGIRSFAEGLGTPNLVVGGPAGVPNRLSPPVVGVGVVDGGCWVGR